MWIRGVRRAGCVFVLVVLLQGGALPAAAFAEESGRDSSVETTSLVARASEALSDLWQLIGQGIDRIKAAEGATLETDS